MLSTNLTGGVFTIQMNRPEKKNALGNELVQKMTEAFSEANQSAEARVVVLTGSNDVFSAGADLQALRDLQQATYEQNLSDSTRLGGLFEAIYNCSKPVIAAVNGHAIAGGCGLLTLCDIVISVPEAKFGYTETRIGFVPAFVARFLIDRIGESQARRLLLSGMLIDAAEAQSIGLITEVTPDFEGALKKWTDTFEKKVSPNSVQLTKEVFRQIKDLSWNGALRYAAEVNAIARQSEDCKKGVSAFLNKEKLEW